MRCPKCGAEIKAGARFCGKCGTLLNEAPLVFMFFFIESDAVFGIGEDG